MSLFILGDLFDWWIGDDTNEFKKVIYTLKKISKKANIYFIAGNRDYLIGKGFEERAKIKILDDPTLIELGNKKTIISHGDALCTDDKKYQNFRRISRMSLIKNMYLSLPLFIRIYIFKFVRKESEQEKKLKSKEIMDVNEKSVKNLFKSYNFPPLMIHGHTHRPKIHKYFYAKTLCKRYVLNDWDSKGSFLLWEKNKLRIISI